MMKPAAQWVVVLSIWVALLGLDLVARDTPAARMEALLASPGEDSLRVALVLARNHDLRLDPAAAALAFDRLLALPKWKTPEDASFWYHDRLGALLARSGSTTVDLMLGRLERLASWAVPVPLSDEPRDWDPLDLVAMVTADPVPGLRAALETATGPARLATIAALGRLGTRAATAIPLLEAAAADPAPKLAALASDSLALVGGHPPASRESSHEP